MRKANPVTAFFDSEAGAFEVFRGFSQGRVAQIADNRLEIDRGALPAARTSHSDCGPVSCHVVPLPSACWLEI